MRIMVIGFEMRVLWGTDREAGFPLKMYVFSIQCKPKMVWMCGEGGEGAWLKIHKIQHNDF